MVLHRIFRSHAIQTGLIFVLAACNGAEQTPVTRAPETRLARPLASTAPAAEAGDGTEADRAVLALESAKIPFDRAPYAAGALLAENIVMSYGTGATELVVGARFDHPDGANSACGAALVKAYQLLRVAAPPQHVTVRLVAFGGEAGGVDDGAVFYADASPPETVSGMLNFSDCGPGNVFSIWDVQGAAERSLIVDALLQAGDSEGLSVGFHEGAPVGTRDHAGFQAQGIPAVGLSAVPPGAGGGSDDESIVLAAKLIAGTVSVFDAFLAAENR
ncbi:MAG: M28 family peptidase [Alphaproteobacteria bacterium]